VALVVMQVEVEFLMSHFERTINSEIEALESREVSNNNFDIFRHFNTLT